MQVRMLEALDAGAVQRYNYKVKYIIVDSGCALRLDLFYMRYKIFR